MRRAVRFAAIVLALIAAAAFTWKVGHTQSDSSEYFPQTGHFVEGAFLTYYRSNPTPELLFGYPITEAFRDRDGVRVQYFQRARFETGAEGSVVRTPLGLALYEPGRETVDQDSRSAACRSFTTGHAVCSDFLRFFETHGGIERFGQPISGVELEGVRHVQYFEYTRLEWVPESDMPEMSVQISPLGWLYFNFRQEDLALRRPVQNSNILAVTGLQVHAFTAAAAVAADQGQEVYVVVQDEAYSALPGADVRLVVFQGPGREVSLDAITNEHGFAYFRLPADWDRGVAGISATAEFAGLTAETRTSFRVGD